MELIFYSVLLPITYLINIIYIKNKFLLNFNGQKHQKFTNKKLVPLSGGLIIIIFLLSNYIFTNIQLSTIFLLIFILGVMSDYNVSFSPLLRIFFQLSVIFIMVLTLNLEIVTTKVFFLDFLLKQKFMNYIFCVFCLLIVLNGTNFIDGCNNIVLGYYLIITIVLFQLNLFATIGVENYFVYGFIILFFILILFNSLEKLYLGDNGVYILALIFGFYLIKIHLNNPGISPYFIVLLLWYPAFENLFSLIRKFKLQKSPLEADTYHLHQLLYFVLNKIHFKSKNVANNITGLLITSYNLIIILLSTINIYSTQYQIILITISILIYVILYIRLFRYRLTN